MPPFDVVDVRFLLFGHGAVKEFVCDAQPRELLMTHRGFAHLEADRSRDLERVSGGSGRGRVRTSTARYIELPLPGLLRSSLHTMLQPSWEEEQLAGCGLEGNTQARAHPRQLNLRSLVHRHDWTSGIVEEDLPASHGLRHFHIVHGRKEASRMRVEHVEVARAVHIDPPSQAERSFFLRSSVRKWLRKAWTCCSI